MVITEYSHERRLSRNPENFLQFMLRKNATVKIFYKKLLRNFPNYGNFESKAPCTLLDSQWADIQILPNAIKALVSPSLLADLECFIKIFQV